MIVCLWLFSNTKKAFWEKELDVQPAADLGLYFPSSPVRSGLLANTESVAFELSFPKTCFSCGFLQLKAPNIMKRQCLWLEGTSSMCVAFGHSVRTRYILRCKSHSDSGRELCQVEEVMHDMFILCVLGQIVEQLFCQIWHDFVLERNSWLTAGGIQRQISTYIQGWLRDQGTWEKQGASETNSVKSHIYKLYIVALHTITPHYQVFWEKRLCLWSLQ